MSLRKVIKTRGSFPSQEAAFKLLYLALEHIAKKWTMPIQNWKAALQRFAILLGDRVPRRPSLKHSDQEHFSGWGRRPKPPRFIAFAPGFLDREASCARTPGIPAPESALGLRLRRTLPSAQVRSVSRCHPSASAYCTGLSLSALRCQSAVARVDCEVTPMTAVPALKVTRPAHFLCLAVIGPAIVMQLGFRELVAAALAPSGLPEIP